MLLPSAALSLFWHRYCGRVYHSIPSRCWAATPNGEKHVVSQRRSSTETVVVRLFGDKNPYSCWPHFSL